MSKKRNRYVPADQVITSLHKLHALGLIEIVEERGNDIRCRPGPAIAAIMEQTGCSLQDIFQHLPAILAEVQSQRN